MKFFSHVVAFILLLFLCTNYAHAAPKSAIAAARIAEQSKIQQNLEALLNEFKAIEKDEEVLAKRVDDLKWTEGQLKKQIAQHKNRGVELELAIERHNAETIAHNARCEAPSSDEGHVNACNAAAAAGNARKAQLQRDQDHFNKMANLINESIRVQSEETMKVFTKHKANSARMDDIRALAKQMVDRLKVIETEVDACVAAIEEDKRRNNDLTRETMHSECGKMFDGN